LHQDADERDFAQPIVSVSLGLPAVFLIGGADRGDRARPLPLRHGDVVVFGGAARLLFHGLRPVKPGADPLFGPFRYNLTFRRAR
jgi:DNA oxidative demethylase